MPHCDPDQIDELNKSIYYYYYFLLIVALAVVHNQNYTTSNTPPNSPEIDMIKYDNKNYTGQLRQWPRSRSKCFCDGNHRV